MGAVTHGVAVPHLSLCLQARGAERAKSGGAHWGELLESMIATVGRRRSALGKHLDGTCLLNHADLCSRWTRPSPRKHEAADE